MNKRSVSLRMEYNKTTGRRFSSKGISFGFVSVERWATKHGQARAQPVKKSDRLGWVRKKKKSAWRHVGCQAIVRLPPPPRVLRVRTRGLQPWNSGPRNSIAGRNKFRDKRGTVESLSWIARDNTIYLPRQSDSIRSSESIVSRWTTHNSTA